MSTNLVLSNGGSFATFAARGITQTLTAIDQATASRRTINGVLVSVATSNFRKFSSELSCTDQAAPSWVWPGMILTVDCISTLSYGPGGAPERDVVPGSTYTSGGHTFYRPRLTMMVLSYSNEQVEYDASVGWTMSLEEV